MTEDPRTQGLLDLAEGYASQRDAALARVAELEREVTFWKSRYDMQQQGRLETSVERDHLVTELLPLRDRVVGLEATLERVREALTHRGDEPAIDTLARIEAALRGGP